MMTRFHKCRLSLLSGLACLLVVACASAPVQEMSDARQAVAAARNAGAAQRTPDQLNTAEQSLREAQEQLQQYRYRDARKRAMAAKEQAVQALRETVAQEHNEQRRLAEVAIAEARQTIKAIAALDGQLRVTENLVKSAEAALQMDDYAKAQKEAVAAKEQALLALNQAYMEKARIQVMAIKSRRALSAELRAMLRKAEAALKNNNGKQAYELSKSL